MDFLKELVLRLASVLFSFNISIGVHKKEITTYVAMQQSELKREEFLEEMDFIDASMIVWLDESGSNRRNGRRMFALIYGGKHLLIVHPSRKAPVFYCNHASIAIMSTRGINDIKGVYI